MSSIGQINYLSVLFIHSNKESCLGDRRNQQFGPRVVEHETDQNLLRKARGGLQFRIRFCGYENREASAVTSATQVLWMTSGKEDSLHIEHQRKGDTSRYDT